MLLCSAHHRLVHEGGYTIRRDEHDRWYFRRPDGRAIPAHGYQLEDMRDEDVDVSAETRAAQCADRTWEGVPESGSSTLDPHDAVHVSAEARARHDSDHDRAYVRETRAEYRILTVARAA